uniref:Serpentine Receptor, class H n=1 Tax=Panagrellus redivivus TaxID=6233 RepID=A0A7E4VNZ6_PANRE
MEILMASRNRANLISLNLTFDVFDKYGLNHSLNEITKVFEIISVAFYPFVMCIIITKSPKKMEYYKYFLMVQSTATATLNLMFILGNPTIVFPFLVLYNDGLLNCNATMTKFVFLATIMSIVIMATTTFAQIAYRIMVTFDRDHFFYKMSRPKIFTSLIVLGCFGVAAIIFVPLAIDPPSADIKSLEIDFPALATVFDNHPNTIGYFPEHFGFVQFSILALFLVALVVVPVVILVNTIMIWRLKQMKKSMQKPTYKLHAVLCRALFVQTLLTQLLLTPFLIAFALSLQFALIEGNIIERLFILSSSVYAVSEFICVLYFITPYRIFLQQWGRAILGRPRESTIVRHFQSSKVFYLARKRSTF